MRKKYLKEKKDACSFGYLYSRWRCMTTIIIGFST